MSPGLPHVCFVAPYAWPVLARDARIPLAGGAELQQSILARALARAGYRVSMICMDFGQPQDALIDGIRVRKAHRPNAGLPGMRFLWPRLATMWRAMRAVDADVYYQRCSDMLTAVVAEFCRRHGKRSVFASASDLDFVPGGQPIRYRRDRWLFERGLQRVDCIVVQNIAQERACRANYGLDAVHIPSCYDPPAGRAAAAEGDIVLWVASMRAQDFKRPELFLELARRLPKRRFVMIGGPGGTGSSAAFEKTRKEAAGLPNVQFTGFLPLERVESYFDRARVLVNTSSYEGMPNTFLQAWARGVPSVAFFDAGARLNGEPVYPLVADIEAAGAQIERLFDDELYWQRISARCRQYFERTHSTPTVLARYEALLHELAR
jgi:glycosyltransferase involved in cell wall biosynthesis